MIYDATVSDVLGPALLPQRVHIREGICQDFEARLTCLTTQLALPVEAFIGVSLALSMRTDQGTPRLFPMILTRAERGRSNGAVTAVHLVGRDPMAIMDERRRYRVFNDMSALEVVCAVLRDWIANTALGASFHYALPGIDLDRYPRRANIVQSPDESDAGFVKRLLRGEGVAWFWRPRASADVTDGLVPALELVLFDDASVLPANDAPTLRYHRRDATEPSDTIDLLSEAWALVPTNITLATWDHKAARLDTGTGRAAVDFGDAGLALSSALDRVRVAAPHFGNDWDDLARLAQVRADHATFGSHGLRGRGGVRTMAPGTWQTIEGYAPFDGLGPEAGKLVTLTVEAFTENNLPAELHEPAQALIGDDGVPGWARLDQGSVRLRSQQRYTNRFACVPIATPIVPACPDERDEPRRRRLTGIVVARDGEVSCDALSRVSVQLVGAEPGADTVTCQRHVVAWGGRDHGQVGVLRAGTEVDLEWMGPDRLVIVGVHYNGQTPPPRFDHLPGLPANAALSGTISRELDGNAQQQLRFNDTHGNISVQLGTDHAATQLNLGSLGTPMIDGRTDPRGEGGELRTDAALALRGGRGVLVSSSARSGAAGTQLDRGELIGLAQTLQAIAEELGTLAATHHASGTDAARFRQLVTHLQDWEKGSNTARDQGPGGAPIVAVSAAAGAVIASQDNLVLGAQTHVDVVSAGHTQLTAGQQIRQRAAAGVSVFTHAGGIEAIAGKGLVDIQAHQGNIQLTASDTITLIAGVKVVIQAPEVHIIGQGTQTQWAGGAIVEQASGSFVVKAASFAQTSGGDGVPAGVQMPASSLQTDEKYVLRLRGAGTALAHRRYRIELQEGGTVQGRSDAQGRTALANADAMKIAKLTVFED